MSKKMNETLNELEQCFCAWEPDVRVLGNIRADDALKALREIRSVVESGRRFVVASEAHQERDWQTFEDEDLECVQSEYENFSECLKTFLSK